MVNLSISQNKYTYKLDNYEVKKVEGNDNIGKYPVNISMESLSNKLEQGYYISPSIYTNNWRVKENFIETQLLLIDIDNKNVYFNDHPYITIEECLELDIVKNNACFYYTTFSHTKDKHRFRIVFKLPYPITDYSTITTYYRVLFSMFPERVQYGIDKSTFSATYLFFGGLESHEIDYNNELHITLPKKKIYNVYDLIIDDTVESYNALKEYYNGLNIIRNHSTSRAFREYIKTVPMDKLLGISNPNNFVDILRDNDNKPSASIFKMKNSNIYLYHQFINDSNHDIIKVIGKLKGLNYISASMWLTEVLGITLGGDSKNIKQLKENIELFREFMLSPETDKTYPSADKILKNGKTNYGNDIANTLDIFSNYVCFDDNGNSIMINFLGGRELAKRLYNKDSDYRVKKVNRLIKMMIHFNILELVDYHNAPHMVQKDLLEYKNKAGIDLHYNIHQVTIGYDTIETINNENPKTFNIKNFNKSTITTLNVEADKYYSQHDNKVNKKYLEFVNDIKEYLEGNFLHQDFVMQEDLLEYMVNLYSKSYCNKYFIPAKLYVCKELNITDTSLTNKMKNDYGLNNRYNHHQHPTILLKDEI